MERKLNTKVQVWCKTFKETIIGEIQKIYINDTNSGNMTDENNKAINSLIQLIYDYDNLKINTADLQKRKRVKKS